LQHGRILRPGPAARRLRTERRVDVAFPEIRGLDDVHIRVEELEAGFRHGCLPGLEGIGSQHSSLNAAGIVACGTRLNWSAGGIGIRYSVICLAPSDRLGYV